MKSSIRTSLNASVRHTLKKKKSICLKIEKMTGSWIGDMGKRWSDSCGCARSASLPDFAVPVQCQTKQTCSAQKQRERAVRVGGGSRVWYRHPVFGNQRCGYVFREIFSSDPPADGRADRAQWCVTGERMTTGPLISMGNPTSLKNSPVILSQSYEPLHCSNDSISF
jgi:hypothetical protein